MSHQIRAYKESDVQNLLELIQLNTPEFFDQSEWQEYLDYLKEHLEEYYVVEIDKKIVGCGGINYFWNDGVARISWDAIHPQYQGRGIGLDLLQYRINKIKQQKSIHKIVVRTTQLVYQFYEKGGFTLRETQKDFWAPGFDLYLLELNI